MPTTTISDLQEVLKLTRQFVAKAEADYAAEKASRGLGQMPSGARELVAAARVSLRRAEDAVARATREVPGILGERHSWPEGRKQRAAEHVTALSETVTDATDKARQAITAARQVLVRQALPKVDRRDEQSARADAKMLLDAVPPAERESKLMELARRDDSIGALVTSKWGRDYLEATGADARTIDTLHNAALETALDAAGRSDDPDRRNAAGHADLLALTQGHRDAVMHRGQMVHDALSELSVTGPGSPASAGRGDVATEIAAILDGSTA